MLILLTLMIQCTESIAQYYRVNVPIIWSDSVFSVTTSYEYYSEGVLIDSGVLEKIYFDTLGGNIDSIFFFRKGSDHQSIYYGFSPQNKLNRISLIGISDGVYDLNYNGDETYVIDKSDTLFVLKEHVNGDTITTVVEHFETPVIVFLFVSKMYWPWFEYYKTKIRIPHSNGYSVFYYDVVGVNKWVELFSIHHNLILGYYPGDSLEISENGIPITRISDDFKVDYTFNGKLLIKEKFTENGNSLIITYSYQTK